MLLYIDAGLLLSQILKPCWPIYLARLDGISITLGLCILSHRKRNFNIATNTAIQTSLSPIKTAVNSDVQECIVLFMHTV